MKLRTTLTALACLTSGAGMAHAAQIASPPLWTGLSHAGACYIRNVGTRPISVQISPLINFTPGFRTADFNNCSNGNDGLPLQPGHTCVLLMNALDDDVTFACSAVVNGSARNVRGNVEIRESVTGGLRVIAADEMR